MNITTFDKESVYEEEIREAIEEISNKCTTLGIPFFFSACVKNDEEGTLYKNEAYLCGSSGIVLKDDRITPHLNVSLGFKTVPQDEPTEIIFDDDSYNLASLQNKMHQDNKEDTRKN